MNKVRESNFELMRILSMIMIVFFHILVHGKVIENTTGTTYIILNILLSFTLVHVNSFVLLLGYFQCDKKMKLSKIISLNNSVWFYTIIILIITIGFNLMALSNIGILKTLIPISYNDYWFVSVYMILYLISPLLNIVINNISKNKFRCYLIVIFLVICVLSSLTKGEFFNNNNGFSLYNFIFLYFIGAYIKKYPINQSYFLRVFSNNSKKLIYIFIFFFMASLNTLLFLVSKQLLPLNFIMNEIGSIFVSSFQSYNNPLVMIQSIVYFLFFTTFVFKNKFINKVSSLVFGVYLIHDNSILRFLIYDFFGFNKTSYGISILLRIVIVTIIIFVFGIIVEFLRQAIFKFIYNLKISRKNRKLYRDYIKSLGINVYW